MTEPARAALAVLRSSANFDWTIAYLLVCLRKTPSGERFWTGASRVR